MSKRPLVVAALVPNLLRTTPGQRAAIEAWEPYLLQDNIRTHYLEFETQELREVLYSRGNSVVKAKRMLSAYARRIGQLPEVRHADLLYVYREAALIGPALIEALFGVCRRPYVYSLDDPIFVPYESPYQGKFSRLKCPGKIKGIVRNAAAVLANSRPIMAWARQYSDRVHYIPSTVDTDAISPSVKLSGGAPVIGWSGSDSTAVNLQMIGRVLLEVQQATDAELHLMGSSSYPLPSNLRRMEFIWSPENESEVINRFDIGVAPMPDNPWNHWKLSGKVTYFMARGIPTVATPIGDIPSQMRHEIDGLLASSPREWRDYLVRLVQDESLRARMGDNARKRAVSAFSVQAVSQRVIRILRGQVGV